MKKLLLALALLLLLAGSAAADDCKTQAVQTTTISTDSSISSVMSTLLNSLLNLFGLGHDLPEGGDEPVFDDGSGTDGSGREPEGVTEDSGWEDLSD